MNLRKRRKRKWKQKRKKLGAQVKLHKLIPGNPGRVGNWVSLFSVPSQMKSKRRTAAVRKKAVRMSAQAVRVSGKRGTGMKQVTRVVAARKAVRMRPELPGTKRRSSAVMRIQRMLTLMMRTEDGPMGVTMIQRVAAMEVTSGAPVPAAAPVAVPVPSPAAVSTQPRRMAVKPQLLIPVKQTVTVTESFQGWRRHDYAQEGTFLWCTCEPFTISLPSSNPLLLIKPVSPLPSP